MIRKIQINENTLKSLKTECYDYADSENDLDVKCEYQLEIENAHTLNQLVTTGVFHDACGKLVEINDKEIIIREEY